jgi:hypothetical protein
MPRPTTKRLLLSQSRDRYAALNAHIEDLPKEDRERTFRPGTMNRNVRDVLGHLHHWHTLLLEWYAVGMDGGSPAMPAPGYTWAATRELNRTIHAQHCMTPLPRMRTLLARSHDAVLALIERHTDAELFTKKRYAWTGSTSLGAYCVSATSSHYDWALKLIRKGLR